MEKYYTLLELNADSESPMIGTLIKADEDTDETMWERLINALHEHFDSPKDEIALPERIEWPDDIGNPYEDYTISLSDYDGEPFRAKIRIFQTWLY